MKQITKQLQNAVLRTLAERSVPPDQRADYLKWLRLMDFSPEQVGSMDEQHA